MDGAEVAEAVPALFPGVASAPTEAVATAVTAAAAAAAGVGMWIGS